MSHKYGKYQNNLRGVVPTEKKVKQQVGGHTNPYANNPYAKNHNTQRVAVPTVQEQPQVHFRSNSYGNHQYQDNPYANNQYRGNLRYQGQLKVPARSDQPPYEYNKPDNTYVPAKEPDNTYIPAVS